jgi:short-subunit dehydrogenase
MMATEPWRRSLAARTALVTGASSGIGREIARGLARRGVRVVVTARRADRLQALAAEIAGGGHPEPIVIPEDLALPGSAETLYRAARAALGPIDLLINNAAAGRFGAVHQTDRESLAGLVALNVGSLVALTQLALPEMVARRSGSILQVASTAAFVPMPYMATYAATKAFVLSFSEAVHAEVSAHGVQVICFCPGRTATEFTQAAGYEGRAAKQARFGVMSPEAVAADAIAALETGGRVRFAGLWNRLLAGLGRHAPRGLVLAGGARLMRPRAR